MNTPLAVAGLAVLAFGLWRRTSNRTNAQLAQLAADIDDARNPICPMEQGHEQSVCPAFPSARVLVGGPNGQSEPPRYSGPSDTILLPSSSGFTPRPPWSLP